MAFTQGFENDVFISYSHRDNLAPRWVDHFHEALLAALKRKLGDDHTVVWPDQGQLTGPGNSFIFSIFS
jgi:hypothetical protein